MKIERIFIAAYMYIDSFGRFPFTTSGNMASMKQIKDLIRLNHPDWDSQKLMILSIYEFISRDEADIFNSEL